jgi:hypothetical protein
MSASLRALGVVREVDEDATTTRWRRRVTVPWEVKLACFLVLFGLAVFWWIVSEGT